MRVTLDKLQRDAVTDRVDDNVVQQENDVNSRPPQDSQTHIQSQQSQQSQHTQQTTHQLESEQPIDHELQHAHNYVSRIQEEFPNEPNICLTLAKTLRKYKEEQYDIEEVLNVVCIIFADHPDLLKGFHYFMPDHVQEQAKLKLQEAIKAAEIRKNTNLNGR